MIRSFYLPAAFEPIGPGRRLNKPRRTLRQAMTTQGVCGPTRAREVKRLAFSPFLYPHRNLV